MKHKLFTSILWVIMIAIFAACERDIPNLNNNNDDDDDDNPDIPPIEYNFEATEIVSILEKPQLDNIVEVNGNKITVKATAFIRSVPETGTILLCTSANEKFPYGFLGKITSINKEDQNYVITTTTASLEETFANLNVSKTFYPFENIISVTDFDGNEIDYKTNTYIPDDDEYIDGYSVPGITLDFNTSLFDSKFILKGELTLNTELYLKIDIEDSNLLNFTSRAEPMFKANLDIDVHLNLMEEAKVPVAKVTCGAVTIDPLIFVPQIEIYAVANVEGEIEFITHVSFDASYKTQNINNMARWDIRTFPRISSDNDPEFNSIHMDGIMNYGASFEYNLFLYGNELLNLSVGAEARQHWDGFVNFDMDKIPQMTPDDLKTMGGYAFSIEGMGFVKIGANLFDRFYEEIRIEDFINLTERRNHSGTPELWGLTLSDYEEGKQEFTYTIYNESIIPLQYGIEIINKDEEVIQTIYFNNEPKFKKDLPDEIVIDVSGLEKKKIYFARAIYNMLGTEIKTYKKIEFDTEYVLRRVLTGIYDNYNGDSWPSGSKAYWKTYTPIYKWYGVEYSGNENGYIDLYLSAGDFGNFDFTGGEEIEYLTVAGVNASKINISECHDLKRLACSYTNATSVNISNNSNLTAVYVFNSENLNAVQISDCPFLEEISCHHNDLQTELILKNLPNLKTVGCHYTHLETLSLSGLTSLISIACANNEYLTSLHVDGCINLQNVSCKKTKITQVIPDFFKQLKFFDYEVRYTYYMENDVKKHVDKGYGWWKPGEPG